MSTIRVDNFGPSAGGTTYSASGVAKAWVNISGTGTAAIRDSLNVASLTDDGTGKYSANLSSAMSDTNYSSVADGAYDTGDGAGTVNHALRRLALSATSVKVRCYSPTDNAFYDSQVITAATFGDLA